MPNLSNSQTQKINKILQQIIKNMDQFNPQTDNFASETDIKKRLQTRFNRDNWFTNLDLETYQIAKENATEKPFSGEYCGLKENGDYYCKICDQYLFDSDSKFDSGTGWSSYFQPATNFSVQTKVDKSYGIKRTEVVCGRCQSHLGHIFEDGPLPTGQRFCMNSRVLRFVKSGQKLDLLNKIISKNEIENLQKFDQKDKFQNLQKTEINQINKEIIENNQNYIDNKITNSNHSILANNLENNLPNSSLGNNLHDFVNTILNNLNQNKITLENAKLEITNLELQI